MPIETAGPGGSLDNTRRRPAHDQNPRYLPAVGHLVDGETGLNVSSIGTGSFAALSTAVAYGLLAPCSACAYFGFLAGSEGRATPHGSYFSFGSGMRSSAAL